MSRTKDLWWRVAMFVVGCQVFFFNVEKVTQLVENYYAQE